MEPNLGLCGTEPSPLLLRCRDAKISATWTVALVVKLLSVYLQVLRLRFHCLFTSSRTSLRHLRYLYKEYLPILSLLTFIIYAPHLSVSCANPNIFVIGGCRCCCLRPRPHAYFVRIDRTELVVSGPTPAV